MLDLRTLKSKLKLKSNWVASHISISIMNRDLRVYVSYKSRSVVIRTTVACSYGGGRKGGMRCTGTLVCLSQRNVLTKQSIIIYTLHHLICLNTIQSVIQRRMFLNIWLLAYIFSFKLININQDLRLPFYRKKKSTRS